jgi:cytochrome oxidase Cu insertion factor (SCO1/SenC/PrrC family)
MRGSSFKGVKALLAVMLFMFVMPEMAHATIRPGGDFSLIDQDQHEFKLQQLRGDVVLLFFGYTSCPDVCPSELGTLAQVIRKFGTNDSQVKALFVSVDPERDTPQKLKQYTHYFSSQLIGLTGTREQIDKVAQLYQSKYKITRDNNEIISVDHSSNLYVIDQQGQINTIVPFGMGAAHIINIVQNLLNN